MTSSLYGDELQGDEYTRLPGAETAELQPWLLQNRLQVSII